MIKIVLLFIVLILFLGFVMIFTPINQIILG